MKKKIQTGKQNIQKDRQTGQTRQISGEPKDRQREGWSDGQIDNKRKRDKERNRRTDTQTGI